MPKIVCHADARIPENPKVRFMRKNPAGSGAPFTDVTLQVARLEIEDLEDGSGACALIRRDAQGELIWRTRHASLQETKWQARFEYATEEADWKDSAQNAAAN